MMRKRWAERQKPQKLVSRCVTLPARPVEIAAGRLDTSDQPGIIAREGMNMKPPSSRNLTRP